MIRRVFSLIFALVLLLSAFAGCSAVADIADSVFTAARQELEAQIQSTLEKNKVEVLELKTAFGKLNDEGSQYQFFCAALVKSNSEGAPAGAARALDAVFEHAGLLEQTGSRVVSDYLVHKDITYAHSDFSGGTCYTIYVYISDLSIRLPERNSTQG